MIRDRHIWGVALVATVAILIASCSTLNYSDSTSLRGSQLTAAVVNEGILRNENNRPYTLYRLVPSGTATSARDGVVLIPHLAKSRFSLPAREEIRFLAVNRAPVGKGEFTNGFVNMTLTGNVEENGCYVIVNANRQVVPLTASGESNRFAIGLLPYEDLVRAIRVRSEAERETRSSMNQLTDLQRSLVAAETELTVNRAYRPPTCFVPPMRALPERPANSYPLEEAKAKAQAEVVRVLMSSYGRAAVGILQRQCKGSQACLLLWAIAAGYVLSAEIDRKVEEFNRPYVDWVAQVERTRQEPQLSYNKCNAALRQIADDPTLRIQAARRIQVAQNSERAASEDVSKKMAVTYPAAALRCTRQLGDFEVKSGTPQSTNLRTF